MIRMTFYSKRDLWLGVLMLGVIGYSTTVALIESGWSLIGFILVLIFGFVCWLWVGTFYVVSEGMLYIHSGPFKSTYDVNLIYSVNDTKNPISAPALSIDRMEVKGQGIYIIISPEDKTGFVEALQKENPNITYNRK